ncbi:dienelactone hydrolase family protein [Mesorhizobium sp. B1-1-8]|uniref:dienelactone hydrolase family protein n=1 Tax=Mesorhizobium sp. B1-1-8 TaxID=2589976 RepID=UPI001D01DD8E|nr:dienelactone hydrolase family protein [Mesorhizobium sp. B1-1-8]UCI09548.1 dienelactone hydrolase family protein [Mesorhizobium sp. B1-1-8]
MRRDTAPDLYGGAIADTVEQGMKLKDDIGWLRICERAKSALADLPASTILAGFSMGCGVVASVWPSRPETKGILLLHALAEIPSAMDLAGLRVQLRVGEYDDFWPAEELANWQAEAKRAKIAAELFVYSDAGHFYTDGSAAEHQTTAADQTWERVLRFLDEV